MHRITQIVERLRFITSIDAKSNLEATDLKNLLWQVSDSANAKFRRKGIRIQFQPGPDCKVATKPSELIRVLDSLVENAVEALNQTNEKWIKISSEITDRDVKIHVIDGGPGIRQSDMEKLFQPFFTPKALVMDLALVYPLPDLSSPLMVARYISNPKVPTQPLLFPSSDLPSQFMERAKK